MKTAFKKFTLKQYISFFLSVILLSQMFIIPANALTESEETNIHNDDYLIYTNELMLNQYNAVINGSVYSGRNIVYTGNKDCIIDGTLNTDNTVTEDIKSDNLVSIEQDIPDFKDNLNNDIYYKAVYTSDTLLSETEYNLAESISVDGELFLDRVTFKNTGYIKASKSIKYNAINDSQNDYTFFLYSENGNITVQGTNIVLNGIIYAPNGKIELNAKTLTINGIIIADSIELNGTKLNINPLGNNDILNFKPEIDIKVTGEQKENRKLTLDISENSDIDRFISDKTVWTITPLDKTEEQTVFINDETSDYYTKNLIIKKSGDYLVEVTVSTDKKSYTYKKVISVTDDIEPVVDFVSDDTFYRTSDDNQALITAKDISYSSDFDDIQNRIWSITFDSDNDGNFDDEEKVVISNENEKEILYKTSHVGKYKIGLQVKEYFDNTIKKYINTEDYLTAYTEKTVTVDNIAPETKLNIEKAKNIDLVFTVGTSETDKINQYSKKIDEIKTYLEENGFTVSVSTVETSSLSAQDTFAWTEYDHVNYTDTYVPSIQKHILYEEKNIVMMGYGWAPLKDFLFVEDNDPSQKIFSVDIQRDNNDWHTMEGGGFLFNTSINEGYMTGYCILLTQQGLKLIYLSGIDVEKLRNGNPTTLQNAGKVLAAVNVGNVLDNHSLKIIADSNTISVWDNGNLIIDNYVLPERATGYGYGPITSHTSHSCSQQSYFTFGNIKMETVKGKSLSDVLDDYNWTSSNNRYVVNLSDKTVQDLRTDIQIAETAKSLLEDEIKFIGLGADESIAQYQSLLQSADGICFENNNPNEAAENIKSYILSNSLKNDYSLDKYITTDYETVYINNYSDAENDPEYSFKFKYVYNPTVFESGVGDEIQNIVKDEPITKFENTGAYQISLQVQDNPAENDSFAEYRKWSDTDTFEKTIYVHTVPMAVLNTEVYLSSKDTTKSIVKVQENSFDNDHISDESKGISDKKYSWKKLSDSEWTDGIISENIETGEIYLIRLIVCDKEGTWSRPCVSVVSSDKVNPDFVDEEEPEISLVLSSDNLNYGDKLSVGVSVSDNICVASTEIYIDDILLFDMAGTYIIDCNDEGNHTVKVIAEDIFGNKAVKEQKYTVTDNRDKIAPVITVISPNEDTEVSNKLEILGSIYDENELSYYKIEYGLQDEETKVAVYETEPVINGTLGILNIEVKKGNVYNIKITASDTSGNISYYNIVYTITEELTPTDPPEENDTIPPVITLSADKETVSVGESVTVNISADDDKGISSVNVYKNEELIMESAGEIQFTETEPGQVTIKVVAVDTSWNVSVSEVIVTVKDDTDEKIPTAEISSPKDNEVLKGTVKFTGTASDNDEISYYRLMYKKQSDEEFTVISESKVSREDEVLAEFDTTVLDNGIYTIRLLAVDKSGNEAISDITVEINNEHETIPDYERPYVDISANVNDGAVVAVNSNIEVSVSVSDNQSVKSIKVYLNDGEIEPASSTSAYSRTGASTKLFSFIPTEAGFYKIYVVAVDESGNEGYSEFSIQAVDTSKTSSVVCDITSPETGTVEIDENNNITDNRAIITDVTQIKGSASSDDLVKYELSYSPVDTEDYIVFDEKFKSVTDGVLGEFDPTGLENGIYKIRLKVYTASNVYGQDIITVQVKGKNKIGNYSIGFTDITLPVYTMAFTVSRTYNSMSRNNNSNFGYGWNMDISNIKVDISHSFSSGWNVSGATTAFGGVYTLKETTPHTVTITYPDNTTEVFYLSLYPKVQAYIPILYVSSYKMISGSGTGSTLEILDSYNTLMFDGGYNLFDTSAKMFEPKNFKLTTKQGIVYVINTDTGIKSITDKSRNTVTFDSTGITHSNGKTISFERDSENRITKITDPEGKSVSYGYDSYGDLTSVTDRNGNTVHYIYGREHELIDIIDPSGTGAVLNEYDDNGRLISSTDANGNIIEYSYDTVKNYETITDALGNQTVYGYDNDGNIISITDSDGNIIKYTYDENGNKLTETDKLDNTITYTYDENDNMTSVTDTQGNVRKMTYSSANRLVSLLNDKATLLSYTYDKNDYVSTITNELGNVETFDYDSRGALISLSDSIGTIQNIVYDDNGNIKSTTYASGIVENYVYDSNGICTSKTIVSSDGTSKTEFYTYDNNGNLVGVKDNLGNYSYGIYDSCGQLISSTDRLGNTVKYDYDLLGNLIKVTYPDNTTEIYTYDAVGNMLTSTDRAGNKSEYSYDKFGNLVSEKYPDGSEIKYEYDVMGNPVKVTAPNGSITEYEYDSLYRNTAIVDALGNRTEYTYDRDSNVIAMKDPNGNIYKFEYDLAGNCTKTIYPDSTSVCYKYDIRGRVMSVIDQIGSKTEYSYDLSDNLVSVKDALGNETKYTYSDDGNLLAVTDANGNKTEYQYDTQNRLVSTVLPTGQKTTFTYDKEGNVISSTDANGTVSKYEYDNMGNITKQTVGSDVTLYTYTDNSLIESITNGTNCTKYKYNNLNQLTEKTLQDGTKISYTYDVNGNLTKITTPYTKTGYGYDKLDRVVRVIDRNGNATLYEYDANGNRTAVRYANGVVATYTYDSLNRLTKEKIVDKDGNNISVYEYTLDSRGNRIKAVEDGSVTEYEYDRINRLTKETVTADGETTTTSYTYDKIGNRLTKTVDSTKTEYTYNSYNQLLTEKTDGIITAYTYDSNGNLLKQTNGTDSSEYIYDVYNRLITAKVTTNGTTNTDVYTYDVEGNRLTKTTNGTLTKYIVDSNGLAQVLAELDSNSNVVAEYTHGTEVVSQNRNGIVHYYQFDGNGNVRIITDSTGTVSDTYTYDAFGNLIYSTGLTTNPYRYCGEYQDETTGLYYLRARYYNSSTGTFITADSYSGTLSDPVSLHKYLYANANPVMNSDPTGYFTLFELSAAICLDNSLEGQYNSAIVSGFSDFMEMYASGERDPLTLLQTFFHTFASEFCPGYDMIAGISALAQSNDITATLALSIIESIGDAASFKGSLGNFNGAKGYMRHYYDAYNCLFYMANPEQIGSVSEYCMNRAIELNNLRGEWDSKNGTTAVMQVNNTNTNEIMYLVSTNDDSAQIPRSLIGQLRENEIYIGGIGHAEETIMNNKDNRYIIMAGGTSRNICIDICQPLIEGYGLTIGGPIFRGANNKTLYRQFVKMI